MEIICLRSNFLVITLMYRPPQPLSVISEIRFNSQDKLQTLPILKSRVEPFQILQPLRGLFLVRKRLLLVGISVGIY